MLLTYVDIRRLFVGGPEMTALYRVDFTDVFISDDDFLIVTETLFV